MHPTLSVIVVTFNSARTIARCLDSVRALEGVGEPEIVVVDNASADDSVALVRSAFPDAKVIENATNRGFAAANNAGIDRFAGDYVLLLNDDAWLAPDCARELIAAVAGEPDVATASPRLYRDAARTTLDSTGIVLNKHRLRPYDRGEGEPAAGRYEVGEEIFGATGACLLAKREAIEALKVEGELFDEQFFAYYEDVDLAWRAQVLGWRCLYVPEAVACHERRGPESKPPAVKKRFLINRYFCYVKNEVGALAWRYLPVLLLFETARFARRLGAEPYLIGAVPLFFRLLPDMVRKRRLIQRRRNASSRRLKRFR